MRDVLREFLLDLRGVDEFFECRVVSMKKRVLPQIEAEEVSIAEDGKEAREEIFIRAEGLDRFEQVGGSEIDVLPILGSQKL